MMMKILMVGGGSGGHILPVKALIEEIIKLEPAAEMAFWTDRKFFGLAEEIVGEKFGRVRIRKVAAGKWRRYNRGGISLAEWIWNARDLVLAGVGFLQSFFRFLVWRPNVVFVKGGYVGLPVGLAAVVLRIPLVTHDSDAVLGLTNRILGRFARKIAVSLPVENYGGELAKKMVWTGVPVSGDVWKYRGAGAEEMKRKLGFDVKRPLVAAVGGGLGARNINLAVVGKLERLTEKYGVVLVAGKAQYEEMRRATAGYDDEGKFQLFDFLTGGHQTKNAEVLEKAGAAVVVRDEDLERELMGKIGEMLGDRALKKRLEENLGRFANEKAAADLAKLVLGVVK
jgi:UDP-N-acetylglucosamine--N-acetylmuramyl-(pentapeptide) pyrophosphoryl-undecaprenol N-acetylglucosamine transferase